MLKKFKKIGIVFLAIWTVCFSYIAQKNKADAAVAETAVVVVGCTVNPFAAAAVLVGAFALIGLGYSLRNNIECQAWGEKILESMVNAGIDTAEFITKCANGELEISLDLIKHINLVNTGVKSGTLPLDIPKTTIELDEQFPMRSIAESFANSINFPICLNPDMNLYDLADEGLSAYHILGLDYNFLQGNGSKYFDDLLGLTLADLDLIRNTITPRGTSFNFVWDYCYRYFCTGEVAKHYTGAVFNYFGQDIHCIGMPLGSATITFSKPVPLEYKSLCIPYGKEVAIGDFDMGWDYYCRFKSYSDISFVTSAMGIESFTVTYGYGDAITLPMPLDFYTTLNDLDITFDISAPDYGIGLTDCIPVSNARFKSTTATNDIEKVAEIAFPGVMTDGAVESVVFDTSANLANVGILDLPSVSSKTYTQDQLLELDGITVDQELGGIDDISINSTLDQILGELDIINAKTGALSTSLAGIEANIKVQENELAGIDANVKTATDSILTDINTLSDSVTESQAVTSGILGGIKTKLDSLTGFLGGLWDKLFEWLRKIWEAILGLADAFKQAIIDALTYCFGVDFSWLQSRLLAIKNMFLAKLPIITDFNVNFTDKSEFSDLTADLPHVGNVVVVNGKVATKFAVVVKQFLSGLFYILTILFFIRKVYKVPED